MNKILLLIFSSILIFFVLNAQEVISEHGMVASAHRLASNAGVEILQQGGNAVDAAVATAFALAVVEPNASSLGGGGYLVLKMANEKPVFVDFREKSPNGAKSNIFYNSDQNTDDVVRYGGKSACVPGMVSGLFFVHQRYGKMPLAQVMQPAIDYCEKGFPVSEKLAAIILDKYDLISANTDASEIYLVDLLPPAAGTMLNNPQLAKSIKQLIKNGPDFFYKGEIAKAIVRTSAENNGLITIDDLQKYRPVHGEPVHGTYRGYDLYSAAPSSGGGIHLIEFLNIMEGFQLNKMKHNSAEYIHILAEAMKIVLKDKAEYMCDPQLGEIPVAKLTDKHYAQELRQFINPRKARFDYSPSIYLNDSESGSTTHLSVIDEQRNIIAVTQSINTWFASGIVAKGTGILLNNHMADFDSKPGLPNSIAPNKRPVSNIAPTILLKDGKPYLTIGTPGGTRIIGVLGQIIINLIDFNMGIDKAIEAARIHAQDKHLYLEGRIEQETADKLSELGHIVKYRSDFDSYFGGAQGILIDEHSGDLIGGADSRRDGVAVGY